MKSGERVLIAGAGPVGLVAANVLADAGVPVGVFESEPRLPETLRGSTFQPPTLDMLDRLGVAAPMIEMGRKAPKVQYRDRQGWAVEFDFGLIADCTAHPYRLQCEQFKLTRLLAERLARFPHARLEYSSPVVGVEQDADSVTVVIEGAAGLRRERGSWLVGADGGRSRVRAALGLKLEGFTWEERYVVISTAFDFDRALPGICEVNYYADPEEWYMLLHVPELWRALMPVSPQETDEAITSPAGMERRMQRICSRPGRYDIAHCSIYAVHQRVADRYRAGRAFLAGDAAHLNNPLGGMGMNGGIHDAFSLAENLVAMLRDGKGEECLERYERQRRPIALEYINEISIANKRNLETRDPAEQRRWRESMDRTAGNRAQAREYLKRASMIASLQKAASIH